MPMTEVLMKAMLKPLYFWPTTSTETVNFMAPHVARKLEPLVLIKHLPFM